MIQQTPLEAQMRDIAHHLDTLHRRSIRIETRLMRLIMALGYTSEGELIQGPQPGKADPKSIFFN